MLCVVLLLMVLVVILLLLMWPKIVGVCSSSIDVGVDDKVGVGVGRWCPSISGVCQ